MRCGLKREIKKNIKILEDLLADVADLAIANELTLKETKIRERSSGPFGSNWIEPCGRRIEYAIDNLRRAKEDLEKVYSVLPPDRPHKLDAPVIKKR